ncbi:LysR family transcriptional regulator [Marinobacter confluentis]|uniref:LysR family transcriptional regulator n=1 Tax=Marinobacter confluentis TaxID=1697557 RepID=A0A4Z1CFX8_9GAMM|nr:LysR family transcriptional regulator [Marinobacter confluentis]TGN39124.1 LysR family transcriptional regulator [Marinobacter confluentis]
MENRADIDNRVSENGYSAEHQQWVWDDTRAFLAIARRGTLSGAASDLKVGIATLSRRIERLEKALGLPLFIRQQSGYLLTEEGSAMVDRAEAMEAAATAFSSGISGQAQPTGKVRLATAENLANELIVPALPAFREQYPGITIELITDIHTVNLHRRDADLALRMVRPERGNVTLRRLGNLGYGLYRSSTYSPETSASPDSSLFDWADFITWNERQADLPAAQWIERVLRGREPALTTTSLASQVAATKAGLGLAVLPHFVAANAGLICEQADLGIDQPIYLVIQSDLAKSRRIRAVADFLVELVEQSAQPLSHGQIS